MEQNIDTHTFLSTTKDKLTIKEDYTREYDDFFNYKVLLEFLGLIWAIFIIPVIFLPDALIGALSVTILFLLIACFVIYYKYRKLEWIFDKSLKKVRLQRVSHSFKRNRSHDFSNIDSITYLKGNDMMSKNHDVKILFKNKKKGKKVYTGKKEKCEEVAGLIADFTEKLCIYDDSKEATTYWDYNTVVSPNTNTALKEDAKIEGNVIFIDIRHKTKIIIDTTLALRKAREKCPYAILRFLSQDNKEYMTITSRPNLNLAKRLGLTSAQTHKITLFRPKLTDNQIVELLK